jgi:hypothetical protein
MFITGPLSPQHSTLPPEGTGCSWSSEASIPLGTNSPSNEPRKIFLLSFLLLVFSGIHRTSLGGWQISNYKSLSGRYRAKWCLDAGVLLRQWMVLTCVVLTQSSFPPC